MEGQDYWFTQVDMKTGINLALSKAIEGGYIVKFRDYYWSEIETDKKIYSNAIFLDPLFWQALGKSLGWKQKPIIHLYKGEESLDFYEWYIYWVKFIRHLASGKDAESFFTELLTTK